MDDMPNDHAAEARRHRQTEDALRQANAELSQANTELARAARLKDEFLASMSHELRTPLHAILGRAETLHEQSYGPLNERQLRAVRSIEESGRRLLDLINDILDLSRIEAGRVELNRTPVIIEPICQSCVHAVAPTAAQKQITLSLAVESNLQVVQADERRLKQALINLLTNAVKFTPPGGAVGLDVGREPQTGNLRVTVWDTGIGIAEEEIGQLFKPFVQLDGKLSRNYDGTGLGLALVERIVSLHSGRVWVESEPGRGSRFIIVLPFENSPSAEPATPPHLAYPKPGPARRAIRDSHADASLVLIADDNHDNVHVLQEYLLRQGYRVQAVDNGRDAVASALTLQPAIIIMDVRMPGMNGLEAIALLRSNHTTACVPIIALTGLALPGDRERCLAAGANDYLSKPVGLRDLVSTIRTHLDMSVGDTP